jgi:hypothetical protein
MNTPQIDPPTGKAFNFPKSGEGKADVKGAGKAEKTSQSKVAATKSKAKSQSTGSGAGKKTAKNAAVKAAGAKPAARKAAKPASKPAAKPTAKTAAKTAGKPAKQTAAAEAPAAPAARTDSKAKRVKKEKEKVVKDKVVRDSFTMPRSDYAKIASIKQKCLDNGLRVKKSELLRAALSMLDAATDKHIVDAVKALEEVKTGRPANA